MCKPDPQQHQPGSTGLVHGVSLLTVYKSYQGCSVDVEIRREVDRRDWASYHICPYTEQPRDYFRSSHSAAARWLAAGYSGHLLPVTAHLLDLDGATFTEDSGDGSSGVTSMNLQAQSQLPQPSNNSWEATTTTTTIGQLASLKWSVMSSCSHVLFVRQLHCTTLQPATGHTWLPWYLQVTAIEEFIHAAACVTDNVVETSQHLPVASVSSPFNLWRSVMPQLHCCYSFRVHRMKHWKSFLLFSVYSLKFYSRNYNVH